MGLDNNQSEKNRSHQSLNLTLAAVVGQVGCLTIVIILAALFGGLWLDRYFDTKPVFTIGLVIASIPVTIIATLWVVRWATNRLTKDISKTD